MVGRPRASSRETIAEAACELFLEQGYAATTVADITTRAGVARSSFFSYFASKADVVWSALDERLAAAAGDVVGGAPVHEALVAIGADYPPDVLALALGQAGAMGLESELDRERAVRQLALTRALAARLHADDADALTAEVRAAALAGAVFAALDAWARDAPGTRSLAAGIAHALRIAGPAASGAVRPSRPVVPTDDSDGAPGLSPDEADGDRL